MSNHRVLNVGQCGVDSSQISRFLKAKFQAQAVSVDTLDEALAALRSGTFELVLINRLFDWDGTPGLDLIRAIKADPALAEIPLMLVSNYPTAQAEAIALGALPGFGKAEIGKSKVDNVLMSIFDNVPS